MSILDAAWSLADAWPVAASSIGVVHSGGVETHGDMQRRQRLASVSKPLSAYAVLVAIEEGSVHLDDAVGQTGCTVQHLLAHAGGYAFEGANPVGKPGVKRIYSNTGFDMLAQHVEHSTGIAFVEYLDDAVFAPLGMHNTALEGSCAKDVHSTAKDLLQFVHELRSPTLIAHETYMSAIMPVFPELAGVVPGIGSFDPCPWGLGFEIRGQKNPHWTGARNSSSTFGHFGGIGTFMWIDPVADAACVMIAEHEFDEWGMQYWPSFNDEVLRCLGR
jgi:CubicO group peptidase (beta-lactamase class C family)